MNQDNFVTCLEFSVSELNMLRNAYVYMTLISDYYQSYES